jgi:hypothetical protein
MAEFLEGLEQFCSQSDEDKVRCLFQIYDENGKFSFDCIYFSSVKYNIHKRSWFTFAGDGLIKLSELKAVLKACIEENGMKFSEKQLEELAEALYEDARGSSDSTSHPNSLVENGLTYEDLKAQMSKHPGLLENLSIRHVYNMDNPRFLLLNNCLNKLFHAHFFFQIQLGPLSSPEH